jgi:outer membrane protein assembly factor BamB
LSVSSASFPYQYAVKVQATNLATGTSLWTKSFPSDNGGPNGFYTSTPDYWRFLASADGTYVLYSGTTTRTLEAIDMATGAQKWSHALPAGSTEPLMAANGNSLYVIGDTAQMAMNIDTGAVLWSSKNSTRAEATSFISGEDPINHPLVLTSGTAWYLDGGTSVAGDQSLVGIDTATGNIIQQIDLTALVAKKPGESLLAVNDIAAANGELAVLLGIRSASDPYPTAVPGSSNGIIYQDLYVFTAVPEPTVLLPLGAGAMVLCRRRRNE